MKLIYKGKFSGSIEDLPHGEHKPGAVQFKEPDMKKFAVIMNVLSFVITLGLLAWVIIKTGFEGIYTLSSLIAAILVILSLFPHELLHAICFKHEVYLYTNLRQGMLFVVGTEDMSKTRFIVMSLLPNIVFGFLPFVLWLVFPGLSFLGIFGALSIGAGAGDYFNVVNAIMQMPKGARTYLYSFHSYWYMPNDSEKGEQHAE